MLLLKLLAPAIFFQGFYLYIFSLFACKISINLLFNYSRSIIPLVPNYTLSSPFQTPDQACVITAQIIFSESYSYRFALLGNP